MTVKNGSNLILNIPHSSTVIYIEDLPSHDQETLERYQEELRYMTDWYTDELFINGIGTPLVSPVSRLICDMERFRDANKEQMERIGMGICYSRKHDGNILADFDNKHREHIIKKYYDPYHSKLTLLVDKTLKEYGKAIILDCHYFSSTPLSYEPDKNPDRPDICIGSDNYHTLKGIIDLTANFFQSKDLKIAINTPYSGTIVPMMHYQKNKDVISLMIEVNRGLYIDEETCRKKSSFEYVKTVIKSYQAQLQKRTSLLSSTSITLQETP